MVGKKQNALAVVSFESAKSWEAWLKKYYADSKGVWLRIQKKGSGIKSPTYAEALDVAICYGWIDGQKKAADQNSWLQKFTPRRAGSQWSKKNTQHAERLIKSGRMKASGRAEIEAAKEDGRWKSAYDSSSNSKMPEDFLLALKRNKKAEAFYKTLNKANLYAISYRLQTAKKPETRDKRMKAILEMLEKGEKFH